SSLISTETSSSDISTLSLHDALPILKPGFTTAPTIVSSDIEAGQIVANSAFTFTERFIFVFDYTGRAKLLFEARPDRFRITFSRSEEHTSELQSRENLVCRLLLEKKK